MTDPVNVDGSRLYRLVEDLYPICRSITGAGVRQTLTRLADMVPMSIHEVPSGTQVLDWTVPREWNIRDAWVATTNGERVVDFRAHNLHVVNYSRPINARVTREELDRHLYSLPDRPEWIPYRTSYYAETWGFCVTQRQRESLKDAEYDVCIDSTLADGHLTYGEVILPGRLSDEVLLSAHVCHPSLANDNLAGIAVLTAVIQHLQQLERRYTYRVLFAPGTIGAITWLALHEQDVARIRHGLIVSCLGDSGPFTYKRSRRGNAEIDRVLSHALKDHASGFQERAFSPDGYDERQYCSPGFNLPVGRLTRTPNGEYAEYHTSADNLDLVRPDRLEESARALIGALDILDSNRRPTNLFPKAEPQLGRRGLYRNMGGGTDTGVMEEAIRWVLNLGDGEHSLLDMAERSGSTFSALRSAADRLESHGLITDAPSVNR